MWDSNDFNDTWILLQNIPCSNNAALKLYQNVDTGIIKAVTILLDDPNNQ